jgi:hypothetical protein
MVLEMEAHVAVKLFHGPIKLIFSVALFAMTLKNVTVDIRHRALECTRNRTTGTRYVGCVPVLAPPTYSRCVRVGTHISLLDFVHVRKLSRVRFFVALLR